MQCPNYIRVHSSSGQDLTKTKRVEVPVDQNTLKLIITAFD